MRRNWKKGLIGAGALLLSVVAWTGLAHAQSFQSANNVTVAVGQTVDSSLYTAGKTIDIAGTVKGDVFCAGQNVSITGTVEGDVICGGQTVHISGIVMGDVRATGQNVTIAGTVNGNVSVAAQSFNTEAKSNIKGDLGVAGSDVTLNGTVGRDVSAAGSTVTINSKIGRNIKSQVEHLSLGSSAAIGGGIEYASKQDLQRDKGAQVSGSIQKTAVKTKQHNKSWGGLGAGFMAYVFVAMLVTSLVLVLVMPRFFKRTSDVALGNLGKTALTGLVASLVVPIVILILALTVIGLPLAILLWFVWLVLEILAGPVAAFLAGRLLWRKGTNAIWIMLLGAVVLLVLYLIPILNIFAVLAAVWFGLGAIIQSVGRWPKPHYDLVTVPDLEHEAHRRK